MTSPIAKRIAVVVAAALGGLGLMVLTGPSAAAETTVMRCVGSVDISFSPGLTNTAQTVSFAGSDHATMCMSQTLPNLHTFEGPFKGTDTGSCPGRLQPGGGSETLTWNANPSLTSVWQYTYTVQRTDTMVVYTATGRISSGVGAGLTVSQQIFEQASDFNACTQPGGLRLQRGTSVWTFTG